MQGKEAQGANALLLVGTYEHTIDAKQRLAIPSEIRERLDPKADGTAVYAVVCEGPTLCLYTEREFERRSRELDESKWPAEQLLLYEQMFYSMAQRLELDKQGRVRLPEHLLNMVDVGRKVVLIGVKDHLEIHDRKSWNERMGQLLKERPDLLLIPWRVMQGGGDREE